MNDLLNSVRFVGKVSGSEVPKLLSKCDILINPRISGILSEAGFPTKLGEYFATKRPVVATSVGDLRLYFENGNQLILVEPDLPQALTDGITFLIENQQQAIKIGQNGFNWAKFNLDYINNANKLLSFLHAL
jgi:glycosyltransferase involved in cell wall biosynthesis